jgi:hypothetical protein
MWVWHAIGEPWRFGTSGAPHTIDTQEKQVTSFMDGPHGNSEVEVVVERDETIFLAITVNADSGEETEIQCSEPADIEEFFHQVDVAKEDYYRLKDEEPATGKKKGPRKPGTRSDS